MLILSLCSHGYILLYFSFTTTDHAFIDVQSSMFIDEEDVVGRELGVMKNSGMELWVDILSCTRCMNPPSGPAEIDRAETRSLRVRVKNAIQQTGWKGCGVNTGGYWVSRWRAWSFSRMFLGWLYWEGGVMQGSSVWESSWMLGW